MLVLIGFLMVNCSKEKSFEQNTPETLQNPNQDELVLRIHQFIKDAEQQALGLTPKSSNKISIDSAIRSIDATINYTYCFHTAPYNKIISDTSYIEFSFESDLMVEYNNVLAAYNESIDSLREKYRNISAIDKNLIGVVIQDLGYDTYTQEIRIVSQVGLGNPPSSITDPSGSFYTFDEYWFEKGSSTCDGSGEFGAPDILEEEIKELYEPEVPSGYRLIYFDSEIYTPEYNEFPIGTTIDNYCDYRIFFADDDINTIDDATKCLDYDQGGSGVHEMDFYLDGASYILEEWRDNIVTNPDGLEYQSLDILHDVRLIPSYSIKHEFTFTFGNPYLLKITSIHAPYPLSID
jgi:hypothetical protein